ncbi:FAD-binding oxidoreductase [Haloarchaeobius baliensis]|uniref:FAD-binding oxidoreductase n=1 Tax=Haloarchaeobius baliensis TaxID=1670458 RepID=UPI003F884309
MESTAPDDGPVEQFESTLRGELVRPGDAGYDDARAVWNGVIDRSPALIVRCAGVADVQRAVGFARETDLPLSVRGGGHNVAGTAVCDDGLVVDCSAMTAVRVDPDARTAWVESGATWADVDHETQAFGLATPGGVVSDTGVAGLTLGGGIGHLRCKHGLSCDNLRSVELVTADGEFVRASETENPELFWGLRGGGGNFGVVTGFEFELHPVGPAVATCLVFYPADQLGPVLRSYREFVADAPREVSSLVFAGELPEEELFDAGDRHRQKFAIMGCYAGDPDEGAATLEPLREFADPLADASGRLPYVEFQQLLDADYPDGLRYYWKSCYLDGLSDAAIDRIGHWAAAAPSPLSTVDVWQLGGAIADVGMDESAFGGRDAPFLLGVEANWEDPDADEANVAWVRDCLADVRRFSDGSLYLNFAGFLEDNDELVQATFGDAYDRLVALKDEYDPTNLFDRNQNVRPSGHGGR